VKRTNAQRGRLLWALLRKPLSHLSGGLVREGKEEDAPGVNAIVEQALDAGHQCARLPRAWTGLEQERSTTVFGRGFLLVVQRYFDRFRRDDVRKGWEQQGVQHLLRDDFERGAKARRNAGAGLAVGYMLIDNYMPRKKKLPRKEVHLNLPSLAPAVVDDAVHPDRCRFRCAGRVDVRRRLSLFFAVTQLCVPDFVRYQERLFEGRPCFLMDDEGDVGVKVGSPSIEECATWSAAFDLDAEVLGYADSKFIR
jgi:hypothetical protein